MNSMVNCKCPWDTKCPFATTVDLGHHFWGTSRILLQSQYLYFIDWEIKTEKLNNLSLGTQWENRNIFLHLHHSDSKSHDVKQHIRARPPHHFQHFFFFKRALCLKLLCKWKPGHMDLKRNRTRSPDWRNPGKHLFRDTFGVNQDTCVGNFAGNPRLWTSGDNHLPLDTIVGRKYNIKVSHPKG